MRRCQPGPVGFACVALDTAVVVGAVIGDDTWLSVAGLALAAPSLLWYGPGGAAARSGR